MVAPQSYAGFIRSEWRFLAFGAWLIFVSSVGQTYFVFVFNDDIRAAFDLSDGDYGGCYAIATLASAFTLVVVGKWIDRLRLASWTLAVCLAAGGACFVLGAASSVPLLILGLYTIRLGGQGLMGHTAFTSMGRYYERERGKAVSIAALGFAAGNAVFPALGVGLLHHLDWRAAWMATGGAVVLLATPVALWCLRGHDARHARHVEGVDARAAEAGGAAPRRQFTRGEVVRDPRFYMLVPGFVAPTFILTGLIFHQRRLAAEKGWSVEWVATCFVAYAAAVTVSSLWTGRAVDRLGARRLAAVYLLPLAASLVVLASGDSEVVALVYLLLAGFTAGAGGPVVGSLWAELYGVLHLGAIRSLSSSCMVVSTALAPFLLGALLDRGVGLDAQAWGCFAYIVLGIGSITAALRRPAPAAG